MNSRAEDPAPPTRGVFANRTLNLRAVPAVGYDMDYTLVHYHVEEWERAAFEHARDRLLQRGWPLEGLQFDPAAFTLGLVFDLGLGNLIKATRFGFVVRAHHGTRTMPFAEHREIYRETVVELSDRRFEFMNTLFELSRASLFTHLVDVHDRRSLEGVSSYAEIYHAIGDALGEVHTEGLLKAQILRDPDRFVDVDPGVVSTLVDQRAAGKQLLLITNSDWSYTRQMMRHALDPFCPGDMTWRDLFDVVIVSANKPRFFSERDPMFRVVDENRSLLLPHHGPLEPGHIYFGGNARLVESSLGLDGRQPLYVGDHLFGDVHVSKDVLRWRTALIVRELEDEVAAAQEFAPDQAELEAMMQDKIAVDRRLARTRMALRRTDADGSDELEQLLASAARLDRRIAPLAAAASNLGNPTWGPLMRAGNDKSLFARQVERYADVYTSRVSNFEAETPFGYLRAARGSLPHDLRPRATDN